ncbi:MAG: NTP transferase domain-containing protein, partial [Lysobacterales bacterium]
MKSCIPKVLQTVGGTAMIIHVLETVAQLDPAAMHVVVDPKHTHVRDACAGFDITWAEQAEQLGTGHAVLQA